MAARTHVLPVSVPGLRALRWSSDALYVGMKETYTITRIEVGHSSFFTRGKLWSSGPGSLRVQAPGDVVRELACDGPTTRQVLALPARAVEGVIGEARIHPHLAAGDARGAAFQRLHDAVQAGADRLALEVALTEAISAFAALGGANCEHTRPVRRAIELLRERLDEEVTLDALADHAGTDKFHLCRAFRAQVGLPPHAYLTRLRIMRAKELLAVGVRPSEIAPRVGLYDQSQLNRHFRRIVGTTPGAYARDGALEGPLCGHAAGAMPSAQERPERRRLHRAATRSTVAVDEDAPGSPARRRACRDQVDHPGRPAGRAEGSTMKLQSTATSARCSLVS